MAIRHHLFLVLSILSFHVELHAAVNITPNYNIASFNRTNFPAGFIFGTASASYPYEGAAQEGGKGQSIWDTFTHQHPDLIADHSNGDVAVDSYHRYKEDVQLLKNMNMPAYGLSISWPRILPTGKLSGGVNQEGIQYYNNLINELLANGITPFVTLFHWDLPQALEDEYIGFTSPLIVNDFVDYAETCFKAFGDRVKNWMTLNVPIAFSAGYAGAMAPMRCSAWQSENCKAGDSGVEPYLASHYQILAHAAAVNLYRNKYQAIQKGAIGIILATRWMVPYSNSVENVNATQRGLEFELGWFMNPLVNGDYPQVMKSIVGNRLPNFTVEESKMVKGSFDFIGMNYFHAAYAVDATQLRNANKSLFTDSLTILTRDRNGNPFGLKSASDDINIYPKGIHDLLVYIKTKYNNPPIYITENGLEEMNNPELSLEEALADEMRVDFHYQHLFFLQKAIQEGINVKGYFCWSFLDSFEWNSGFTIRFGLHFVDYRNGLKRYPKLSAQWFKNFLA